MNVNDLYNEWYKTAPDCREEVESRLSVAVLKYAKALLWLMLQRALDDLTQEISIAVMTRLNTFRRKSKFSVWVQGIAQRKCSSYLRKKYRDNRIWDHQVVIAEDFDEDSDSREGKIYPSVPPCQESEAAVKEFLAILKENEVNLVLCKYAGLEAKEIAEKIGATVAAVNSRTARVKPKAKKILSS